MPSRMERYYETSSDGPSRSRKNQELYNQIYEENTYDNKFNNKEYSNISGVAETPDTSTINIQKIREMINSREEKIKPIEKEKVEVKEENIVDAYEEQKNYDINDVLNKAKDERPLEQTNDYHSLKNLELNILKNLNISDEKGVKKEVIEEKESIVEKNTNNLDEIPELLNTITNTSMLNKLGDKELSLDLLGDLKSNGTTFIGTSDAIKNVLDETNKKEEKEKNEKKEDKDEIDKSFFTKSLDLKDSLKYLDGDQDDDEDEDGKSLNTIIAIVVIAAMIVVGVALFIVFKK